MKRTLISSVVAMGLTAYATSPRRWKYLQGPALPESPNLNKERLCSSCRVGIVGGTKCFACASRRRK
jgi:hypothetical protein